MLDANLAIGIRIGPLITVNSEATTSKKRQVRCRTTVIVVCSPGSTSDKEITASRGGEQ